MKERAILLGACLLVGLLSGHPATAGDLSVARDLVNKGNYLMASNRFTEALKTYQEALKHDPGNAVIKDNIAILHNNWGRYYSRQKKYYEALQEFEKCLELNPNYGPAKTNITLLHRYAEADGVDLDAPPDQKRDDVPIPPPALPNKPQQGKLAPTEPEAGAVLFIGGVKQPVQTGPQVDAYPMSATTAPASTPANAPTMAVSPVLGAPVTTPPAANSATTNTPMYGSAMTSAPPAVPGGSNSDRFVARPTPSAASPQPVNIPSAVRTPVGTATNVAAPTTSPAMSASPPVSLDEQLTAVEMKVYGCKQANLTVLQRLEKIEVDSTGQMRQGTITERIDYLRRSFGL